MSMLQLSSSFATRAILLSGRSALLLSSRVLTFQVARLSTLVFIFVFLCIRLLRGIPHQPRLTGQGMKKLAIFRAPFLAPSSMRRLAELS